MNRLKLHLYNVYMHVVYNNIIIFSSVEPIISLASDTHDVLEDDDIIVTCTVTGSYPASTVEWLKGASLLIADNRIGIVGVSEGTQLFNSTSTLSIHIAVISDTNTYTCRTLPFPVANPILPSVMDSLAINVAGIMLLLCRL